MKIQLVYYPHIDKYNHNINIMIVLSWDVGIINLAYCILKYDDGMNIPEILDWDIINLMDDDQMSFACCGKMINGKDCASRASYYRSIDNKIHAYCKVHMSKVDTTCDIADMKKKFELVKCKDKCKWANTKGTVCDKCAKYKLSENNQSYYFCTSHYKSVLNKKIKSCQFQSIKKLNASKTETVKLQSKLIEKLDAFSIRVAALNVDQVIIENQPVKKNGKMKAIGSTLQVYYMIRGYTDKYNGMNITKVKLISPSNKLKVNNDNTIEMFESNKDDKTKYKLTKALGIQYTKTLIASEPILLEHLSTYKKKDDLCDAYLQGIYYLMFYDKPKVKKVNNIVKK